MVNVGHCFEIGSTHLVCQDYCLSGSFEKENKTYYYGILSDGCSSSKNTDVGSRLLTFHSLNILKTFPDEIISGLFKLDRIKDLILKQIEVNNLFKDLINENVYDATLLMFLSDEDSVRVMTFGDGNVYCLSDNIICDTYEYESNAPLYISYYLNNRRYEGYMNSFGDKGFSIKGNNPQEMNCKDSYQDYLFKMENRFKLALFSDGLSTFRYSANSEKQLVSISISDSFDRYLAFPQVFGNFVERNFNFNKKANIKKSIEHFDDLSCVSLVKVEDDA